MRLSPPAVVLLSLVLLGCNQPNHLGNPLTLPVRAVSHAAGEAAYNARRSRVSAFLTTHQAAFQTGQASTNARQSLLQVGKVKPEHHQKVLREIAETPYGSDWVERATIIVMVHS